MWRLMIRNFFYSFLFVLTLNSCTGSRSHGELSQAQDIWKSLPVQQNGRVKPFDTFSREILRTVYGRETYKKRSAVEVLLSWLIVPDFWDKTELILIEQKDIKKSLDFPVKSKRFRPSELQGNQKLALHLVELKSLKQRKEKLDSYFQNLEKLENRLVLYTAVKTGLLIRLEPQKNSETWLSLPEMTKPGGEQFRKLLSAYIRFISKNMLSLNKDSSVVKPLKKVLNLKQKNLDPQAGESSFVSGKKFNSLEDLKKEMQKFQTLVFKKNSFQPPKIKAELFYNSLKPFQKAWIFYFLFLFVLTGLCILKKVHLFKWLMPFPALGFAFHSLGMLLRSYIMSRPPVSNMYETVIWVPWVALIAGFVFYLGGTRLPFIAGVLLAGFCLFLTSLAPEILDGSLQPLEAVLNSSFWLSTHVLIITMSYSFFFLAFVLGDMALISFLINKSKPMDLIKKMFQPIYRSIQWGVVLLAAGTILGGIWADYSWGRFWGWDPKECWALVTLLAYLALLHGRLVTWIKPFGMAIGSVMMFFSVIMAWYGVNFVLGAGLHSYGFGTGGVEYVLGFLILHLILCGLALFKHFRLKS